jgi:hypothetical protein
MPNEDGLANLAEELALWIKLGAGDEPGVSFDVKVSKVKFALPAQRAEQDGAAAAARGEIQFVINEKLLDLDGEGFGFVETATLYDTVLTHRDSRWRCDNARSTVMRQTTRQGPTDEQGATEDATAAVSRKLAAIYAAVYGDPEPPVPAASPSVRGAE